MQMHADDERFEVYLKQFRPRQPEPLPNESRTRLTRRVFALGACATAVAVAVIAIALMMRHGSQLNHSADGAEPGYVEPATVSQPLTIHKANALLAHAPSLKAAMDLMAFHPQNAEWPKNQQSVLFVLSKEKN